MNGITAIAQSISSELQRRLPKQRKTQRTKLALLVSTMLDVRSANLMDLAAGLPLDADRTDLRYQWIVRLLSNPLVISDVVMEPFAREVLEQAAVSGEPVSLILDQSKMSERHQVLMLALRWGERALPLAWRVEQTDGAIGFDTQKALLEAVAPWLPGRAAVRLLGDRFYGTADLIGWCQERGWDYRLRLKGNLAVFDATGQTTTGHCAKDRIYYLEDVELTARRARTHIGIIHDPGHAEPWIIAMSEKLGYVRTLEYSARWGIEPMFSDFKSRGFGLEDTQLRYADRLDRLILVMALALYIAVSTGQWDAVHRPTPSEKKSHGPTKESRPKQNLLVHPRSPPHRQADAIVPTAPSTLERHPKLIGAKPERPSVGYIFARALEAPHHTKLQGEALLCSLMGTVLITTRNRKSQKDMLEAKKYSRNGAHELPTLLVLATAVIALSLTAPRGGDFWWYDAPRHALNGVFIRDLLSDLPLSDPAGYAMNYYLRYPALTIMLYPPMLYLISAPFFALFGISQTVALVPVFILYFTFTAGTYALARRWMDWLLALGLALALAGSPVIALWGRQVMLEVPCYAFLVWSVWFMFRYIDRGRSWLLYAMALLFLCAMYTKLSVMFMAPVLALGLLLYRGAGLLKDRHAWAAATLLAVGMVPLVIMTFEFGRANIESVSGMPTPGEPVSLLVSLLWYLRQLPQQLGWPILGLATAFLVGAAAVPRWRLPWRDAVFFAAWFVVGYLFFSAIELKEARHNVFILLPVVLAAILLLDRALPRRLAGPAAVSFGVAVLAVTLLRSPVPYLDGYREAAELVADIAPRNSVIVFSGHRDGSFIFAMREREDRRDLAVLRATKLLANFSIDRNRSITKTNYSEAEIAQMISDYGAHYVVAETDFWTDLTPMRRLQSVLRSPQFEVVRRIPVVSNLTDDIRVPSDAREIVVYRNLGPVAEGSIRLSIELPAIGRTFEGTLQ